MGTKLDPSLDRSSAPCPAPMDPKFDHDHGKPDSALSPDKGKTVATHSVSQANDAPLTNAGGEPEDEQKSNKLHLNFDFDLFSTVNSHIREERFDELLSLINIDRRNHKNMNMVDDPVLIIAICAKKTQLAIRLIDNVGTDTLKQKNIFGDTALHIAAAEGNTDVAKALLRKEPWLIEEVNIKRETALHMAAMYGHEDTFRYLVDADKTRSMIYSRNVDGSTVLHSAIMANEPNNLDAELALDIATIAPILKLTRNEAGLTPLQLVATLPYFFHSPLVVGSLRSFLHKLIPLEEESKSKNAIIADEEAGGSINIEQSYGGAWKSVRSKFPSECTTILNLIELIGNWFQRVVFNILKPFIPFLQSLERENKRYATAMKLVESLTQPGYDFYCKGLENKPTRTAFDVMQSQPQPEKKKPPIITPELDCLSKILQVCDAVQSLSDLETKEPPLAQMKAPAEVGKSDSLCNFLQDGPAEAKTETPFSGRWLEPPLIIAAELGQHDLVRKILHLCPESAMYLDSKDRNVVQVAIQSEHKEVVSVISEIFQRKENPLHSFLCSMLDDDKSRNTILHLAAMHNPAKEGDALQLHHEIEWFEMVEKIVPKAQVYSRNREEETAHELFTKNHKKTLEDCQGKLVELGKACAGLVAAAVFTSSFSIPQKDSQSDNRAYTIFTHAYVIGFGCATSALVLFLSLALIPYQQRYFRKAIPRHFLLACLSFALALVGFLISFACNFVLQIYGKQKMQLFTFLLELLLFPLVCIAILIYSGSKLMPSFRRFWK